MTDNVAETTPRGLFIAFEGGEGSGKSTQAKLLVDALRDVKIKAELTHEPGDTELGKKLRAILLDPESAPVSKVAQALLFAADRAEHVQCVIDPLLQRSEVVVCDRYMASTMAYQGYGEGLWKEKVDAMSRWAAMPVGHPDVTYYLDVDPGIGLVRAKKVAETQFEMKDLAYHDLVRKGFKEQIMQSWVVLDARRSIEDLRAAIFDHALGMCQKFGHLS